MKHLIIAALSIFIFSMGARSAQAQESEDSLFSVSIGVQELIVPEVGHVALYQFVGVSRLCPISERFALIPGLSFEVAPGVGNYGFVGSLTADFLVHEHVALDATLFLVHDQDPTAASAREGFHFYVGGGVGPSFLLGKGVVLSPAFAAFVGSAGEGMSMGPSLTLFVGI